MYVIVNYLYVNCLLFGMIDEFETCPVCNGKIQVTNKILCKQCGYIDNMEFENNDGVVIPALGSVMQTKDFMSYKVENKNKYFRLYKLNRCSLNENIYRRICFLYYDKFEFTEQQANQVMDIYNTFKIEKGEGILALVCAFYRYASIHNMMLTIHEIHDVFSHQYPKITIAAMMRFLRKQHLSNCDIMKRVESYIGSIELIESFKHYDTVIRQKAIQYAHKIMKNAKGFKPSLLASVCLYFAMKDVQPIGINEFSRWYPNVSPQCIRNYRKVIANG